MQEHQIEIAATPQEILAAVEEAAEMWGAEWRGTGPGRGELKLPVTAGIRQGYLKGRLSTEVRGKSSRLVLEVEESRYAVHMPAFVVLLMGGAGGLATVVLPFYPKFMNLLPSAVLLALVAWFLVVSRLRSRGAEDFLGLVADIQASGSDGEAE